MLYKQFIYYYTENVILAFKAVCTKSELNLVLNQL